MKRAHIPLALVVLALLGVPQTMRAQADTAETSLGDLARSIRKKKAEARQAPEPVANHPVIDNDNLSAVMDEAASTHKISSMLFSIDSVANKFQVSSPDVTCSLAFDARAAALLSNAPSARDLPETELARLDGPATMDGNTLQISIFNGTEWELREIVIGLTVLRGSDAEHDAAAALTPVGLLTPPAQVSSPTEKRSDVTYVFHLRGTAVPFATTVFREALDAALGPEQDWHWSILQAKGIPPRQLTPAPTQTSKVVLP
ncbi:MAG TPA: hypothetical protein VFA68_03825 [Terriglobales bacterium]|nr:hypothetical protein [Terriglobales bacterium]